MSFLNWTELSIGLEAIQKSPRETLLTLKVLKEHLDILVPELEDILGTPANSERTEELRLVLPQNWLLFWKKRSEGARLLLAHPNSNEWVGTVALGDDWGARVLAGVRGLEVGQKFIFSAVGQLHTVSNLDLVIEVVQ